MLRVTSVGLSAMVQYDKIYFREIQDVQQSSGLFAVFESDMLVIRIRGNSYNSYIPIAKAARNKGLYQSFSTFFAEVFSYPPDIVQIIE